MAVAISGTAADAAADRFHNFRFTSIDGAAMPMDAYKGKAVLVVNTASQCGFTHHYEGLQALWERYRDRGFVVLGVPSNDFGGQEPGAEAEIKTFCETTFGIDFPMTSKQIVKGDGAHPFYRWARAELGALAAPKWNFHKYLIAPDGRLVDWFSTVTKPRAEKITSAIERALPN